MYRNQVAGHSPLFWHSGTICKPLIRSEYDFYAQLERDMPAFMPFVPKFYGLLDLEQLTEEMASSITSSTGGNEGDDREPRADRRDSSSSSSSSSRRPSRSLQVEEREKKEEVELSADGEAKDGGAGEVEAASATASAKDGLRSPTAAALTSSSGLLSLARPSGSGMTANHNAWSSNKLYNKWYIHTTTHTTLRYAHTDHARLIPHTKTALPGSVGPPLDELG